MTRFDVGYITEDGGKDSLKIEIGYMRRIPVLPSDIFISFTHLRTGDEFLIQTPQREELFGNKFCTFLYRYGEENTASSRDLFDLYNRNPGNIIKNVMIDDQLKNLIRNRLVPANIKEKTQIFLTKHLDNSKKKYKTIIDTFFDDHQFEPTLVKHHNLLNTHIIDHPSILWNLKQLKD